MGLQFSSAFIVQSALVIFAILFLGVVLLSFIQERGKRQRFFLPLLFRLLLLLSLALVLAGPYTPKVTGAQAIPVLIDVSDSIDLAYGERLYDYLIDLSKRSVKLSLYPFAKEISAIPFSLSDFESFSEIQTAFKALDPTKTSLGEGLKRLFEDQRGSQVVLASDGYGTKGSIQSELVAIKQKSGRVYPIVPDPDQVSLGRFGISQLYVPLIAQQMTTSQVRVTVENTTQSEASGKLEVLQGSEVLYSQNIRMAPASEQVFFAQTLPAKGGTEKIRATLKPHSAKYLGSERDAYMTAEGREKVLLLSGSASDAAFLGRVLQDQAYQLDNRVGGASLSLAQLEGYSTIILNNIPLDQLGRASADAVAQAVRSGKGMVMVGGDRSFGLGGYRGSSIEEVLPVEILPPQKEERRLNVAVMLVIDKSRSMDADNKMNYAKEAARTFIMNLKDEDYIGVIAFDASPFIVVRLGVLSEIRALAADRIGRIFPTGSTRPLSAIDEARRSLMRVSAGRKHMLFLTDGQIEDAGPHYKELVKQMRILGITSSTVMLGGESDGGFLRSLAEQGGGAYYQTNDARSLPKIFLNDVRVASGERTLKEQQNYNVSVASRTKRISTIDSYPDLLGYVQTRTKPGANLELVLGNGEKQEPLLAHWSVGQGKVTAFTSDASGRWSRDWIDWSSYHQFWNQLLNATRPESEGRGEKVAFDMIHFVEDSKLVIEYAIYAETAAGIFEAQVGLPNGETRKVQFSPVSVGRYRAEISSPEPGRYNIAASIGDKSTIPVAFSLPQEGFVEQKGLGINIGLLKYIAQYTDGMINPSADVLNYHMKREGERESQVFWFFLSAIFFALFEILAREVFLRGGRRTLAAASTVIVIIMSARVCGATPQDEYYIAQALDRYFSLPQDARALAMESSSALLCRGSFCNYSNPAGLAFSRRAQVQLSFSDSSIAGEEYLSGEEIEQVQNEGFIAGVIPLGAQEDSNPSYGSLGLGFSRFKGDTDDSINSTPDGHRRTVAYGLAVSEDFGIGYSFTFYDDQLRSDLADLHSHARILHIFGFQSKITDSLEFGGTFQLGLGQSDTEDFGFNTDGLSHLKQYSSAIALKKNWNNAFLALAADFSDLSSRSDFEQFAQPVVIGGPENGFISNFRLGGQIEIFEDLVLRSGYRCIYGRYHFERPDLLGLGGYLRGSAYSAGLGYQMDFIREGTSLDYGLEYQTVGKGDWVQALSISFEI